MSESAKPKERKSRGRFSAERKREAVVKLLRGAELDSLSRELGVKASTLADWRDRFLAAGTEGLKTRRGDSRETEIRRLKAKIGDLVMDKELLEIRCRRMGIEPPLASKRRRR